MLFSGTTQSLATEVHHCEFANAHDVYLFGDSMRFHHNLVDTVNDDGLAFINDTKNTQIHENVLTRSHTALSFDGERIGQVWIYRNLFDTREPTLGNRPPLAAEPRNLSLRTGLFYKDGKTDGPIDFFHNTCLVRTPGMIGVDATNIMRAAYTLHADHATPAAEPHPAHVQQHLRVGELRRLNPSSPWRFSHRSDSARLTAIATSGSATAMTKKIGSGWARTPTTTLPGMRTRIRTRRAVRSPTRASCQ